MRRNRLRPALYLVLAMVFLWSLHDARQVPPDSSQPPRSPQPQIDFGKFSFPTDRVSPMTSALDGEALRRALDGPQLPPGFGTPPSRGTFRSTLENSWVASSQLSGQLGLTPMPLYDPIFQNNRIADRDKPQGLGGEAERGGNLSGRASRSKPELPEEARRYAVQGLAFAEAKQYQEAAAAFSKVNKMCPWYPQAFFNRAIVLAMMERYADAMSAMNTYLEIVPDAPDARAARDQIYKWEALAKKP